jgi:hypothetical protein
VARDPCSVAREEKCRGEWLVASELEDWPERLRALGVREGWLYRVDLDVGGYGFHRRGH